VKRPGLKSVLAYSIIIFALAVVLFPFVWMILTAITQPGHALDLRLLPERPTLSNFKAILTRYHFGTYFLNSLIVATFSASLSTLFASMAGYIFAKKEFIFKEPLYWLFISSLMIPGMMFMVPQFAIVFKLGQIELLGLGEILRKTHVMGINTYGAMIIPHLANVFGLILMRQFITTVPTSLLESASIDGASEAQLFKRIIIPLSLPVVATLFLLNFQFHWGNFLWQLIIVNRESLYTVPVGLAMFKGQYEESYTLKMAASCVSIVPISILFVFAQRTFIEGMTKGAVKE
jgi:ABC-type glycerol-3-phosphate transport system permease component